MSEERLKELQEQGLNITPGKGRHKLTLLRERGLGRAEMQAYKDCDMCIYIYSASTCHCIYCTYYIYM